jgi:hypothetical protein
VRLAITIRNKKIEAGIRKLGCLRSEGPSAVIGRLVDRELAALGHHDESEDDRLARRRTAMQEWIASLPPVSEEASREIDRMMEDMYDEDGLPR